MNTEMIVFAVILVAVFVVPYLLFKYFSAKKKRMVAKAVASLLGKSGLAADEQVELQGHVLALDKEKAMLAVVDKANLDRAGEVVDLTQLKSCSIASDTDNGNLVKLDLVLSYKNAATPEKHFAFYKLGVDSQFDARMLQERAESMQLLIRGCINLK